MSDSDSSSDDEFATAGSITRRKLLADFYGKTEGVADPATKSSKRESASDKRHSSSNTTPAAVLVAPTTTHQDRTNLESPYFDVAAHTSTHVVHSSVQTLLELDEQLTLQVRTLDSTTQNMVYENYSKFIDATDAVKSVGINVAANQDGLQRLQQGMETIHAHSKLVEDELGSLRDAVAEKIRVKRLLSKLDSLLKLPETLKEHILQGRFRTAASSYLTSTTILGQHSAGFESLQKIETECSIILQDMVLVLNRNILSWSGQDHNMSTGAGGDEEDSDDDEQHPATLLDNSSSKSLTSETAPAVDPPNSISEILECAGTLAMLGRDNNNKVDVKLSVEQCKNMSLAASIRFLDRLLDTHQLEIQESAALGGSTSVVGVAPTTVEDSSTSAAGTAAAAFEGDHSTRSQQSTQQQSAQQAPQKGHHLVPTMVVDAILEAATLFRMSFPETLQQQAAHGQEEDPLEEFIKEVMSSFLLHVRSVLLEYSVVGLQHRTTTEPSSSDNDHKEEADMDGEGDELYEEVAGAMSILIHSVRELASGLSLPEVGVSADVAADLVEQASELTETLVRRRVDQKFCDLRLHVVSHCLVPFAHRIGRVDDNNSSGGEQQAPASEQEERAQMLQVIQIAVSDCLQLLDDTVRSIVSGREVLGASAASVDLPMLKQSIQASTGRFASWLAGTLEVLAGCESSDSTFSFEAADVKPAEMDGSNADAVGGTVVAAGAAANAQDDLSEMSGQYDVLAQRVDDKVQDLIATLEEKGKAYGSLGFALKVFEMCRGCERAFLDNMTQSIESNVGGGKKGRSSGLFDDKKNVVLSEHERKTSGRFQLAASRILTLYAMNLGFEGAAALCSSLATYSTTHGEAFPTVPSQAACQVLEIAKQATVECENLFGEKKRPGPLPSFSDVAAPTSQPLLAMNTSPLKGLQLDVERMFQEKISIYPHPSNTLDFTRDAILTVLFKVVVKALAEQTRLCSFTAVGFNNLLMDVELLRGMTPHYVDKNYQVEGSNACSSLSSLLTEVMTSAVERCDEIDWAEQDDMVRSAVSNLKEFIKSDPGTLRFIIED